MLLSRAWTQAGINTLKTDARATRVLQFIRDEGEMSVEENALIQAGRELLVNTTHHIEEVETRTGTTTQWYDHLKNVDIDTNRMIDYVQKNGGMYPRLANKGEAVFFTL